MVSRKVKSLMLGVFLCLGISCSLISRQVPTTVPNNPTGAPKATAVPTFPPTMQPTATPFVMQVDPQDINSFVAAITYVMLHKDVTPIDAMVGAQGTWLAPYGVGLSPMGEDNGNELAAQIGDALEKSQPICMGVEWVDRQDGLQDAVVYFDGVQGLADPFYQEEATQIVKFGFFHDQDQGQVLFGYVVPMPDWSLGDIPTSLQPCPDV